MGFPCATCCRVVDELPTEYYVFNLCSACAKCMTYSSWYYYMKGRIVARRGLKFYLSFRAIAFWFEGLSRKAYMAVIESALVVGPPPRSLSEALWSEFYE